MPAGELLHFGSLAFLSLFFRIRTLLLRPHSLLLLDLPKGFMANAGAEVFERIALCVLPCDFASALDVSATKMAISSIESKNPCPILPVYFSSHLDIRFTGLDSAETDLVSRAYPFAIPKYADGGLRTSLSTAFSHKPRLEFANGDAQSRYWSLLQHILNMFNIDLECVPSSQRDADFFDLVDNLSL